MGNGDARFGLASARVMANDYGDEVVAANLDTGWFYSFTGTHRAVWCALADGYSVAEVKAATASPSAADVVDAVVEQTVAAQLLAETQRPVPERALAPVEWLEGDSGIEAFDDLQDALLLDPVHDVADAGWPFADPAPASGQPPEGS